MRRSAALLLILGITVGACGGSGETTAPPSSAPVATPAAPQTPSATAAPPASQVTAPDGTPTPSAKTYVVKSGDTLTAIAKRFKITLAALRAANPDVTDPRKLQIGHKLVIPTD